MYTFGNLCQEKITLSDNGFKECYAIVIKEECDISKATEIYAQQKEEKQKQVKRTAAG